MISRFLLCLALLIPATAPAQSASPAPPPPLAKPPENVEWTVTIKGRTTRDPATDTPMGIIRQQVRREGRLRRYLTTRFDGQQSTSWVIGDYLLYRLPGWRPGNYNLLSGEDEVARLYTRDFPGFEIVDPAHYTGKDRLDGRLVHRFESDGTTAWIDHPNGYPVRLQTPLEIRDYTFAAAPATPLVLPDDIRASMARYEQLTPGLKFRP